MIKRLCSLICLLFSLCFTALANQEVDVDLKGENAKQTIDLPFAKVSFEVVTTYSNVVRIRVSVENATMDQTILLFKSRQDENTLKKYKPKFKFEKTYPGRDHRFVTGCNEILESFVAIPPASTKTVFTISVHTTSPGKLKLPVYLTKFKHSKFLFWSSEAYKILSEEIIDFNINAKIWSDTDPTYVQTKKAVNDFISSLKEETFCSNRKHSPSLSQQLMKYEAKRDSLRRTIKSITDIGGWITGDDAHTAYNDLSLQLNAINLDDFVKDCGGHKAARREHSCSYCQLSAQEVYHKLDDVYQQLLAYKITKAQAEKDAKAVYNCYQNSTKRKKDSFYTGKITGFYNRITK